MIKSECLSSSEEPNVNQITIQDNTTSNLTAHNIQRAQVKTETNRANITAGPLNNNCTGNTGNRGQMKQQGPKGKGVLPANSNREFRTFNQDYLDDDDDILAAVADDDYFAQEEDFDMEQINQLEIGMQNTAGRKDKKTTTSTITCENNNLEMPYVDEVFEDDFGAEDLLAEAADSFEIKPLHERICSEENVRTMHGSKKARISNSSSVEFSSHLRNTNSSSNSNIQTTTHVNSRKPNETSRTLNIVKTEPVSLMNNATFNSCSVVINTGPCCKPKNAGVLKLSSNKTNVGKNSSVYSARPLFSQTSGIQIKKESGNEVTAGRKNDHVTPVVAGTDQRQSTLMHSTHRIQGNGEL